MAAADAVRRSSPAPAGLSPSSRAWPSIRLLSVGFGYADMQFRISSRRPLRFRSTLSFPLASPAFSLGDGQEGCTLKRSCNGYHVPVITGAINRDHVHMLISIPPQLSVSKAVQFEGGYGDMIYNSIFHLRVLFDFGPRFPFRWLRPHFRSVTARKVAFSRDHAMDIMSP